MDDKAAANLNFLSLPQQAAVQLDESIEVSPSNADVLEGKKVKSAHWERHRNPVSRGKLLRASVLDMNCRGAPTMPGIGKAIEERGRGVDAQ